MSLNGLAIFEHNLRRLMNSPDFKSADDAGRLDLSYRMIRSKYSSQPLPEEPMSVNFAGRLRILETHWPLPTCDHCGRVRVNEGNCEGCGSPMRFTVPGLPHWTQDQPLPEIAQPAPVVAGNDDADDFFDGTPRAVIAIVFTLAWAMILSLILL